MKKEKDYINGGKNTLIMGKDFNINESADHQLWERAIMDILYNNSGLEESPIYLLDSSSTKLPEHDYRDMKSDDFISMLNENLSDLGEIGLLGKTGDIPSDQEFLNIMLEIGTDDDTSITHLILITDRETDHIEYIGGIQCGVVFMDSLFKEIKASDTRQVFKVYPMTILTDLTLYPFYYTLRSVIRNLNLGVSADMRALLKREYTYVGNRSGGSEQIVGLCDLHYGLSDTDIHFKPMKKYVRVSNPLTNNFKFDANDLEHFLASEPRPDQIYYIFNSTSADTEEMTRTDLVLYVSGFTAFVADPEIKTMSDLFASSFSKFEIYAADQISIDIPLKRVFDATDFNIPRYDRMSDKRKREIWVDMCYSMLSSGGELAHCETAETFATEDVMTADIVSFPKCGNKYCFRVTGDSEPISKLKCLQENGVSYLAMLKINQEPATIINGSLYMYQNVKKMKCDNYTIQFHSIKQCAEPRVLYNRFRSVVHNMRSNGFSGRLINEIKKFIRRWVSDKNINIMSDDIFRTISKDLVETLIYEVIPKGVCCLDLFSYNFMDTSEVDVWYFRTYSDLLRFLSTEICISATYYVELLGKSEGERTGLMWIKNLIAYGNKVHGLNAMDSKGFRVTRYNHDTSERGKIATVSPRLLIEKVIYPTVYDRKVVAARDFIEKMNHAGFQYFKNEITLEESSITAEDLYRIRDCFEVSSDDLAAKKIVKFAELLDPIIHLKKSRYSDPIEYLDMMIAKYGVWKIFSILIPISNGEFESVDTDLKEAAEKYIRKVCTSDVIGSFMRAIESSNIYGAQIEQGIDEIDTEAEPEDDKKETLKDIVTELKEASTSDQPVITAQHDTRTETGQEIEPITMEYLEKNLGITCEVGTLHPHGFGTYGDCYVNALCRLTGFGWKDTLLDLCRIGVEKLSSPNSIDVILTYLDELNISYKYIESPPMINYTKLISKEKKAMRVIDFLANLIGTGDGRSYLLFIKSHVMCYKNNVLYQPIETNMDEKDYKRQMSYILRQKVYRYVVVTDCNS